MSTCFFRLLFIAIFAVLSMAPIAHGGPDERLIGHWGLDGNAHDSASAPHDGTLSGRAEFFESPVGGSGKLLWCNGVDTAVKIEGLPDAGAGDFTVSLWICPLDSKAAMIVGRGDASHGWSVEMLPNQAVSFRVGARTIVTAADRIAFGQWYHIAAAFHNPGKIALYVNGALAADGDAGAGNGAASQPLRIGEGDGKTPSYAGLIDDVRVYSRSVDADEIAAMTDAGLPWLRSKPSASIPFGGHFSTEKNDVVVLVGGEDANASQAAGYLETLLTAGAADKRVLFRDMAWEGDTVFEQWRIINFGPWSRQFERVGASVLFVQFGQMESFAGKAGLEEFVAGYVKLLDEFEHRTRRIVLLSPTPFMMTAAPWPDRTRHNGDLASYAAAVRKLAEKRGLLYVDLFSPLLSSRALHPLTRDGLHLTTYGHAIAAREIARQLGVNSTDPMSDDDRPRFQRQELETIRTAIVAKNALWSRYWRPINWAFMNGDRISQPSSRDHIESRIRWLPAEVQEYLALVERQESKIAEQAKKLGE
ncbi:MAG TPA: LamG-like jellyroll fold domain-containing protein [Tepidisphaeraceae bacterium]|jgi:hypothetical protein|nr:LamG-like jellyroll fold domain-containing protein [Tepidisphaeraceae bacterium]